MRMNSQLGDHQYASSVLVADYRQRLRYMTIAGKHGIPANQPETDKKEIPCREALCFKDLYCIFMRELGVV